MSIALERPAPTAGPTDLATFSRALASPSIPPGDAWQPLIVELEPGAFARFTTLCQAYRLRVVDAIDRQLDDLAIVRLPSADLAGQRPAFVQELIATHGGSASYGAWVYFPWEAMVVHVLPRNAYFDVITNRNRDKITREEQALLRTKRVAVVGLSVGGEAALTVAQENLCGTIVLADFDRLDLSNLNRLSAACDDLGQKKAIIVARRVAKLNPYLDVRVFPEGVTAANLGEFLDGVDLVLEECDDLQMKYAIRLEAKARGVNIVYAADERGFLSVEPYGQRPDLPPFHGRVTAPPPPREAYATPQDFLRALTDWLGGWDGISERSRESLERVGRSLSGYPQLASEARYAAGQLGHVARRLLLGERLPPFGGNLDLADLLPRVPPPLF